MTVTPYLKLQKPPFDTIPWDDAINGNMDIIDAFIANYMAVPNYVGAWQNHTSYIAGQNVLDVSTSLIYTCQVTHTSADAPTTFPQDRVANPSYWVQTLAGSFPVSTYASQSYVDQQVGAALNDDGRNKIHNPQFLVTQRGLGPFTTSVYCADRWVIQQVGDTVSYVIGLVNDTGRAQIGDEEALNYLSNTFTGNAGAGSYNLIAQRIENVRRLAGKTVTISFWANCGSGTPKIGINLLQSFGTGGSPSGSVRAKAIGNTVTVNPTWARYTTQITIPSIAGKSLGTNGDSYTELELWFSSGSSNNDIAGQIGVQSSAVSLWGVQLEIGTTMTALEKRGIGRDLADCYRYYATGLFFLAGYTNAAVGAGYFHDWPVPMRGTPVVNATGLTTTNCTGVVTNNVGFLGFTPYATGVALGGFVFSGTYFAVADL